MSLTKGGQPLLSARGRSAKHGQSAIFTIRAYRSTMLRFGVWLRSRVHYPLASHCAVRSQPPGSPAGRPGLLLVSTLRGRRLTSVYSRTGSCGRALSRQSGWA
ncbi:hypothetical protein CHELA1G11_14343 [Hyphomicrobiales bacterium]|nr:hypothetical protein CHELA1G11_14343 [Hyphomicrobiales bacterium]CAH1680789.1 hypothetical protein CHELA1G2_14762 [Hyphomicrobiales bacterium]